MLDVKVLKWVQKKLLNEEKVIAKAGRYYATDERLLHADDRFEFKSLEYDKISDITHENHGLKRIVVRIISIFLGLLLYIIGWLASTEWETYIGGHRTVNYPQPWFGVIGLIFGSLAIFVAIFRIPQYYYQIHSPSLNKKQFKQWRLEIYGNKENFNRFIKIVKEKTRKNTKQ